MSSDTNIARRAGPLRRFLSFLLPGALFAGALMTSPVVAQNVERIAAVVNDAALSLRDLETRIRYSITLSELPDNPDIRRRVGPQVLRKLIDETIQSQEAERLRVIVSEAELNQAVASVEERNKMPPGGFAAYLRSKGIDFAVGRAQIKADLLWLKLVRQTQQAYIRVSEDEAALEMERLRAAAGQPEYLLAEIFLPIDTPSQEADAKSLGERLIEQLKSGASFPQLAQQFSQSATAASGGDLGWVADLQLDSDLRAAIQATPPGSLSSLVSTSFGFYIVAVRQQRLADSTLPPREEIVRRLEMEKLELMSRRFLRDLRRSAFIDIRL